jgi:hypothetical protein
VTEGGLLLIISSRPGENGYAEREGEIIQLPAVSPFRVLILIFPVNLYSAHSQIQ